MTPFSCFSQAGGRPSACLAFFSLLLILTLAGCSPLVTGPPSALAPEPAEFQGPERVYLENVPFYAQEEYQCGPASLAMLLAWNDEEVSMSRLIDQVYSPGLQGSLQPAIIAAARRHGYLAYPISGDNALRTELAAGHPVLVLKNLGLSWVPRWHYAVVIGYDRNTDTVFLHSGDQEGQELSARVFANTWARADNWGLVVLSPERLPATATETSFITAAVGLERAEQHQAAALAYETALQRWPESFVAWMGLGNNRYLLDDPEGAVEAFRQAARLQPDNGIPLNNLAVALASTGRRQEALATITQAIALGGEMQEKFEQTWQEILDEKYFDHQKMDVHPAW